MKPSILIAASVLAFSLAGCKKEAAPSGDLAASPTSGAVAPASPAASAGQAFADTAAASDMFEIESSRLAASKAEDAKVKRFAEQMIKAHTESTAKLKNAASNASPVITPAPQMTAMQQQTLADLGAKAGAAFDAAYKQVQVDAHQMTLDSLKAYSANGDVPSLTAFATEMVPIVTAHLNMAKSL